MQPNEEFLVRVEGGCQDVDDIEAPSNKPPGSKVEHLTRRDDNLQISNANSTLLDPYGDGRLRFVAASLGELQTGTYNLTVLVDDVVEALIVIDEAGIEYARYGYSSNLRHVTHFFGCSVYAHSGMTNLVFDVVLGEDGYAPAGLFADVNRAVNLSYAGVARIASTTSTSSSSTPTAVSAEGHRMVRGVCWYLLAMVLLLATAIAL